MAQSISRCNSPSVLLGVVGQGAEACTDLGKSPFASAGVRTGEGGRGSSGGMSSSTLGCNNVGRAGGDGAVAFCAARAARRRGFSGSGRSSISSSFVAGAGVLSGSRTTGAESRIFAGGVRTTGGGVGFWLEASLARFSASWVRSRSISAAWQYHSGINTIVNAVRDGHPFSFPPPQFSQSIPQKRAVAFHSRLVSWRLPGRVQP